MAAVLLSPVFLHELRRVKKERRDAKGDDTEVSENRAEGSWKMKLEEELAAQSQWEEKVGGHWEEVVQLGETLGQKVVGRASLPGREPGKGRWWRPVRCQRHQ